MPPEARSGQSSPERCLIEVLDSGHQTVGRGIIAGRDPGTGFGRIVTCAHVVNAALPGRTKDDPQDPGQVEISVRFPFSGSANGHVRRAVKLVKWLPNSAADFTERDMACLSMAEDLPDGITVPTLVPGTYPGGPVKLMGLSPRGLTSGSPGYVTGKVLGRLDAGGRYQADQEITGYIRVRRGASGGPVWDQKTNQIVGLVQAGPRDEDAVDVYVLGAELIEEASDGVLYQALECPYVGLSAFKPEDEHRFFGRQELVDELVAKERESDLLVVTGVSGSGKSSVVRAGLLPRLSAEGQAAVGICDLSERPFLDVVGALASAWYDQPLAPHDVTILESKLEAEGLAGCMALLRGSGGTGKRLVLVLDQFERIIEADPAVRERFLAVLGELAARSAGGITVVIVVREDLKHHFTSIDGPLGARFRVPALWVDAMMTDDLHAAITGPVDSAALPVTFEDGLVDRICQDLISTRDLRGSPLPHLQIVMTLLWERQTGRKLTFQAYQELGGVSRVLARYADKCLADLGEDKRQAARRILTLLVMPKTVDVARRVKLSALRQDDLPVAEDLVNARLVTTAEDQAVSAEKTIEIAHEALLRSWSKLQEWLRERREFVWWYGEAGSQREEWIRSGRDPEHLLLPGRLALARQMRERFPADTKPIADFIEASAEAANKAELDRRRAQERKEAIRLAGQSELALGSAPARLPVALALGICALREQEVLEADSAIRRALAIAGRERLRICHGGPVRCVAYGPGARLIASASADGECQVHDVEANSLLARLPHQDGLADAAFDPAGTRIATGGAGGVARVWDFRARPSAADRELRHGGPVIAVAFSADGRRLATASNDGTARIWEWDANAPELVLPHGKGPVTAVGFVPGRPLLLSASYDGDDGYVRVWDAATGQLAREWKHDRPVRAFAFNPAGTRFATAGDDWTVRIFDPDRDGELLCLKHQDSVAAVAFSPDGRHLASANDDGTARIWNVVEGFETVHLTHVSQVYSVHFSPDGARLATASEDQTARIWSVSTGEEVARLVHESGVRQALFGSDGATIATASDDATARIWHASAGGETLTLPHGEPITATGFAVAADGGMIATAGGSDDRDVTNGTCGVRIWDGLTGEPIGSTLIHPAAATDIAFGNAMIAVACADGYARLWDLGSGSPIAEVTHDGPVNAVAIDPERRLLATASNDGTARLWDIEASAEVSVLQHRGWVGSVAFCPDGTVLATATADGAYLWRTPDSIAESPESRLLPHDSNVYDVIFARSGSLLVATVANDGKTRIWGADDGRLRQLIPHGGRGRFRAAFSPDGSLIATAGEDGTSRVWRVQDGTSEQVAQFVHEPEVRAVAFSPDGICLATVGEDGTARIWSVRKQAEVSRLVHGGTELSMAFSPDGRRLATVGADGFGRVWALTTNELIDQARARLTRDLSRPEWARYLPGVPYQELRRQSPETSGAPHSHDAGG